MAQSSCPFPSSSPPPAVFVPSPPSPPRESSSRGHQTSVILGSVVNPASLIASLIFTAISTSCPPLLRLAQRRWQPDRKRNGAASSCWIFQRASATTNSSCLSVRPSAPAPSCRPNDRTRDRSRTNVARISRAVASSTAKMGCPDVVLPRRSNFTPERSTRLAPNASRCAVRTRWILICHCGKSTPWTREFGSYLKMVLKTLHHFSVGGWAFELPASSMPHSLINAACSVASCSIFFASASFFLPSASFFFSSSFLSFFASSLSLFASSLSEFARVTADVSLTPSRKYVEAIRCPSVRLVTTPSGGATLPPSSPPVTHRTYGIPCRSSTSS